MQKRRKSVGRRKKVHLADGETPLVDPDDPAFMPGTQKEQPRQFLTLPPDAENIPGLKPETIEETEKRIEEKTVKWVLFQVCCGAIENSCAERWMPSSHKMTAMCTDFFNDPSAGLSAAGICFACHGTISCQAV